MRDRRPVESEGRASPGVGRLPPSFVERAGVLSGVAVAYAGLATLGFIGSTTNPLVSSIWPAAGLALIAFWRWGRWCWPSVAAAAFAANALHDAPLLAAAIIGIGNATGPMVAARVLSRTSFSARLDRMHDGLCLLACGAALGSAISALVGAAALGLVEPAAARALPSIGLTWWSGDALGVALVAPLAFAWMAPRDGTIVGGRAEARLLGVVALGLTVAVFLSSGRDLAWTAFPMVAWGALRFGVRGSSAVVALVAVLATAGAASGLGPFARTMRPEDLLVSQIFLSGLAASGLLLATFWREHRVLLARLLQLEALRAVAEELTGSGSWAWDPQADCMTCSDGLHRVLGTSQTSHGTTMLEYLDRLHPSERELVDSTIRDSLHGARGFHGEAHVIRAGDASPRIVESFGRVLRDAHDMPVLVGACVDITERKRVETDLRLANNHLQALLDASPLAILELDRHGAVRSWSSGAERVFGWSEDEVLGVPNPSVPPDAAATFEDMLARAFNGEESHGLRQYRVTKHGARLLMRLSCAPVRDHTEAVVSAVTVLEDETARERLESAVRSSEEDLRDLIHAAPVGIFRKSTDGELLTANQSLVSLLGYPSTDALLAPGKRHHLYHDPHERERVLSAFRSGAESLAAVVSLCRADGTAVRVQWDARAVRDASGRIRFIECFVRDLTERLSMEHALRESRDRLAVLSRRLIGAQEAERRSIARGLHDEVGQTLTAVRLGLVALRSRWPGSGPPAELMDSIVAVDVARHSVLDMSLDLRPSILDDLGLEAALRWYVDRVGQRAGVRVHVESDLADQRLDPHVETACYRIAQEALSNVVRHARAASVEVGLELFEAQLELVIEDDGRGFDVETSAAEPLDDRLGLAGMAERASLTGGELHVRSAPGRGTRVTAVFPIGAVATGRRGAELQ
ncbi:MAG: PAS domain S-box protein [Gemmatimonadaceae bacterium]